MSLSVCVCVYVSVCVCVCVCVYVSVSTFGKDYQLSMSCSQGIITSLLTDEKQLSAVHVLDHRDEMTVIYLPDMVRPSSE